jgi:hypothetical protein
LQYSVLQILYGIEVGASCWLVHRNNSHLIKILLKHFCNVRPGIILHINEIIPNMYMGQMVQHGAVAPLRCTIINVYQLCFCLQNDACPHHDRATTILHSSNYARLPVSFAMTSINSSRTVITIQVSQKYRLSLKVRHLEMSCSTEKYFEKFNIFNF